MASLIATSLSLAAGQDLSIALSGIFGSISLTAWICLLTPQLITNYQSQSADGISMAFLFIWLCGDITNLFGALLTGLAPTALALAIYFCFADAILISQCLYYNRLNAKRKAREALIASIPPAEDEVVEDSPLLQRRSSTSLPGSHLQPHTHTETTSEPIRKVIVKEDEMPDSRTWLDNALNLLAVYIIGFLGWYMSAKFDSWNENPTSGTIDDSPTQDANSPTVIAGQIMGYLSALFYLCARIPQIYKNYQEKSCEGLALLFFLLSLTGNLTYAISLVTFSQSKEYLIKATPWLIGSAGTILEDSIIFVQFQMYGDAPRVAITESGEV